jgi:site-specific DNA recombinase
MRAGLYDRVSDDQDGRSRSVAQQGIENEKAAQAAGWRVAGRYADPGVSASRFARRERDDWPRLMEDLRAGQLDVVVLWESSRGDRKLTEWSAFLDTCRERGVKVHVTSHERTYDLSRARDWRTLAEEGVSNAYASEETSLRIRRDMADAAAAGRPHGRVAYGYRRRYDPLTRALIAQEPDPEQAPVVREVVTRIAAGEAISALIADLNERGVSSATGGRWARSSISRLVLNGVCYIGKRRHNGGPLLDGDWPPLVDEAMYWRAVAVLSDPARKAQADGRGGILPGRSKWLLSYLATCGKCGAGLSVTHRMRACERTAMYRCASSRGGCAYAPVEWLDGVVADEVIGYLAEPERWRPEGQDKEAQTARDEAAAERSRLEEFEALAKAGEIGAGSFARVAAGIEERIAELEERARELSVPGVVADLVARGGTRLWQVDPSRAADRRFDMLVRWEEMPLTAQRRLVSEVCSVSLEPANGRDVCDESRVLVSRR